MKGTRKASAIVLIFWGCLLASLSVPVVWLHEVVADTYRYVETVAPLSEDPAIKDAVATYITDELIQRVNAEQMVRDARPERDEFRTDSIGGMINGLLYEQVRQLLDTQAFAAFWKEANRQAHQTVMQILKGEGETVYAREGKIYIDLGTFVDVTLIEEIKSRLAARGIDQFQILSFEDLAGEFIIFDSPEIAKAQRGIELLDRLAYWLPLLALLSWGAGVWFSVSRLRAIFWAGIGLAFGMLLMQVSLWAARDAYLRAIQKGASVDVAAATSFFDIIIHSLKTAMWAALGAGLVAAAGAFLAGTLGPSAKVRRAN